MAVTPSPDLPSSHCAATMPPARPHLPIEVGRIRELLPHAGSMCLLERVVECDAKSIRCETRTQVDRANPLRRDGPLSSVCAIEYAAQAMALHGALNPIAHDSSAVPMAAALPWCWSEPDLVRHGGLIPLTFGVVTRLSSALGAATGGYQAL